MRSTRAKDDPRSRHHAKSECMLKMSDTPILRSLTSIYLHGVYLMTMHPDVSLTGDLLYFFELSEYNDQEKTMRGEDPPFENREKSFRPSCISLYI